MGLLHSQQSHWAVRAFSLVELLLAVSIAAVLAILAFPVGRILAENIQRTKCVHNLRQIGVVVRLYGHEHNKELPGFNDGRTTSFGPGNAAHKLLLNGGYIATTDILFCPADKIRRPTRNDTGWAQNPEQGKVNYGFSGYMHFYHRPGSLVPDNIPPEIVPRYRLDNDQNAIITSCQWTYGPFKDFHKDGSINVLRLGGRVDWISKETINAQPQRDGYRLYSELEKTPL